MKLLAIDTATEACSVSLYLGDASNSTYDAKNTIGVFEICPQQQSQQILPMIDKVLASAQTSITTLDGIAYGRGPGSFTGLRIAASTAQGLALGCDLPVVEVSTLATMAQECFMRSSNELCSVLIDARMQEVYQGLYLKKEGLAFEFMQEKVHTPAIAKEDILSFIESNGSLRCAYAGTGFTSYQSELTDCLQIEQSKVDYPNAQFMLPLAFDAVKQGKLIAAESITPVYVRDTVTWKKLAHKN